MHFIKVDGYSPWTDEAKKHLRKISIPKDTPRRYTLLVESIDKGTVDNIATLARESPEDARSVLEREVWLEWVAAISNGRQARAELMVRAAEYIATILAPQGDRLLSRLAKEMDHITRLPANKQKSKTLFKSLLHLKAALELRESGLSGCLGEFRLARQGLRSIRSPLALSAQLWEISCVEKNDSAAVMELLKSLESDPLLDEYATLRARFLEVIGKYQEEAGNITAAIETNKKGLEAASPLADKFITVRLSNRIATNLESLGRDDEAWEFRHQALRLSREVRSSLHRVPAVLGSLGEATRAAIAQRRLGVALHFQNQYLRDADRFEILFPSLYGRLLRARIALVNGKVIQARKDLEHVIDAMDLVPVEDRPNLAAQIEVVSSRIRDRHDQATAIIDDLILMYQDGKDPGYLGAKADMLFRGGETAAAEAQLVRALEELERRRAMIASRDDQASFLDREMALYERMIALQLNLGRPEKALEILERFRARTLLDQLNDISSQDRLTAVGKTGGAPLSTREIVRRMPARTLIVVYAVIGDRLTTWVVRPSGVVVALSRPDWKGIVHAARRLHEVKTSNFVATRHLLEELHRSLVEPWQDNLHEGDRIVFIPALDLFNIPFAALIEPGTGRFLVQDHAVGIAPSASQFIGALDRDRQESLKPYSVLLVGDPSRGSVNSFLPRLPSAIREVEDLRNIYQGVPTEVLRRREATSSRVRNALERVNVAHFAVHAIVEQEEPANSRLVLAAAGETQSYLYVRDILQLQLGRMHLVILSACETHAGPVSISEGSLSLATAFLAAGVPAVVGTLWRVEDQVAARLAVRFHEQLRSGSDALSALRAAQLQEITTNGSHSDLSWANYQVIGGVAASSRVGRERRSSNEPASPAPPATRPGPGSPAPSRPR